MRHEVQSRRAICWALISLGLLFSVGMGLSRRGDSRGAERHGAESVIEAVSLLRPDDGVLPGREIWQDSFGDGFPDRARLDTAQDRENFVHWFTFLAEAQYYRQSAPAREEIQDCSALIRYAYRNALVAHTPAWRRAASLPYEPGFGDVRKFVYPHGALGRGLFRTRAGPFDPCDLDRGGFAEFADSAALRRYNAFPIPRDIRAARSGDLLFFYQPGQREPYHAMLFVGSSHFQPQDSDWIVYHTGDPALRGRRGEIRTVRASLLLRHPNPAWRPFLENPRFLGVYRWNLLRR